MDEKLIKEYYERYPEGIPATKDIPEIFEMHQILIDNVTKILPCKLLDAGCGKGYIGESVSKYCNSYYGLDLSFSAIKLAQKRLPHGSFLTGSLKNLPYKTNYFDCVICSEVIEHIPEYKKAIKEISRVTKKGKYILITLPNRLNPDMKWRLFWKGKYTSQIYDNPAHYKELIKEFSNNGLDIIKFSSFFYLPLWGESLPNFVKKPLMWTMRYYSKIIRHPIGLYLFFKLRKR